LQRIQIAFSRVKVETEDASCKEIKEEEEEEEGVNP
jgi:hypothetical protein